MAHVLFEDAYDPRVVADKVPDEQLYEARGENDGEHGVRRPNPISEKSSATTTNSGRYVKGGDGENRKLLQNVNTPRVRVSSYLVLTNSVKFGIFCLANVGK